MRMSDFIRLLLVFVGTTLKYFVAPDAEPEGFAESFW